MTTERAAVSPLAVDSLLDDARAIQPAVVAIRRRLHRHPELGLNLPETQETIVDEHPCLFVRGLIHSDGCRVMNRVWNGRYEYPRYFFSQVSTDIMGLFCRACRQLGVEYRFNGPRSVSIARRASVALVDGFVGPKT